jgi:hypothetical protein
MMTQSCQEFVLAEDYEKSIKASWEELMLCFSLS